MGIRLILDDIAIRVGSTSMRVIAQVRKRMQLHLPLLGRYSGHIENELIDLLVSITMEPGITGRAFVMRYDRGNKWARDNPLTSLEGISCPSEIACKWSAKQPFTDKFLGEEKGGAEVLDDDGRPPVGTWRPPVRTWSR